MTSPDVASLVLVLAASAAGAILSRVHHRVVLPTVVVEIVLGILIGSEVLDIAELLLSRQTPVHANGDRNKNR